MDLNEVVLNNNAALDRLLGHWQRQEELRRGRERSPLGEREAILHRARLYVAKEPAAISGQHGHDRTFHVACVLVQGFGLTVEEGLGAIQDWNRTCQPPWTEAELRHKLEDAAKDTSKPRGYLLQDNRAAGITSPNLADSVAAGEPVLWEPVIPLAEIPDADPFPVDVLPGALQSYVQEVAWALNCPVDFVAVPLLVVAGGAIGNARRLAITRTHRQSACLFTAIVGHPGSAKSPALDMVGAPLEAAQRRYLEECRAARAAWRAQPDTDLPQPVLRRCVVDDATTEALVAVLAENPRGLVMLRDELAALVTGMNQYRSGGRGYDRQVVLKLWSHAPIRSDRKGNKSGEPLTVYRPFVALAGNVPPSVVDSFRGELIAGKPPPDDGFLDRFLFSYPPDLPDVEESWRDVSLTASEAWDQAIQFLLGLDMVPGEHGPRPHLLQLDDSGRQAWVRFTREHAAERNTEDFPDYLRGPWSKLRGYCGRLALVLHCLREACGEVLNDAVDGASVGRAARLVSYFKSHSRKVLMAMDADPLLASARRILHWIRRKNRTEFKRNELFRDVKSQGRFPRLIDLDAPLALLVRHGFLRIRPVNRSVGPGRPPSPIYEVNPSEQSPKSPKSTKLNSCTPTEADLGDLGDLRDCSTEQGEVNEQAF